MVTSYGTTGTVRQQRGLRTRLTGKKNTVQFVVTLCFYLKDLNLQYFHCLCGHFPGDEKKPASSPFVSKDSGECALIYKTDQVKTNVTTRKTLKGFRVAHITCN